MDDATAQKPGLLDEWQDLPLEELLRAARDLVEDSTFPTVKRWQDAGGKVLGHFQVYFPEELAHAAGMLPVKIRGAQIEARQADSRFGSYLCSIVRTSLELALSGTIKPDIFVTHPICDAARNLTGIWGRNFSFPAEILCLPQNPNSADSASYLRDEYARLLHELERIVGREITEPELRNSIRLFNENRRLLRELYAIKRETPWLLSIDDAYALVALGGFVPREEHNRLLRAAVPMIRRRTERRQDRIRVVFEGGFCEQPPLEMLRVIAQSCYVVDDDLLIGLRWIEEDVPAEGVPLLALAEAYLDKSSYSPVQHDLRKPKEKMLLQRIERAGASAAIITAAKMCEPGLDEQVAYAKMLDEAGIPYFVSEFEENMTSFDHVQMQLETFVENVLFD
jgi:benzoyl-CoA reductase subunit C